MSVTWGSGRRRGGRMELIRDRRRARVFWLPLRSIVMTLESAGKIQWIAAELSSVMKSISPSTLKQYWKTLELSHMLRQTSDLRHWPYFNSSDARSGNPRSDVNRFFEIFCIDQEVAAELLAGLGKRAVRDHAFAVADLNASCLRC